MSSFQLVEGALAQTRVGYVETDRSWQTAHLKVDGTNDIDCFVALNEVNLGFDHVGCLVSVEGYCPHEGWKRLCSELNSELTKNDILGNLHYSVSDFDYNTTKLIQPSHPGRWITELHGDNLVFVLRDGNFDLRPANMMQVMSNVFADVVEGHLTSLVIANGVRPGSPS
ncbi:MAG: hypothetical protein ACSHX7_09055 [Luteolibacter sp.]